MGRSVWEIWRRVRVIVRVRGRKEICKAVFSFLHCHYCEVAKGGVLIFFFFAEASLGTETCRRSSSRRHLR